MLFFAIVFVLIIISILIIYTLKIDIVIKDIKLNYEDKVKEISLNCTVIGKIFGKIKIFQIQINEKKIKKISKNKIMIKLLKNKKVNLIKFDGMKEYIEKYKKKYNYNPIEIKNIKIDTNIQIVNIFITNYLIVLLSTILSIILMKFEDRNNRYKINLINKNNDQNLIIINLVASGIITINLAHIINIFVIIFKERRKAYGRKSSNRGLNEYSYD